MKPCCYICGTSDPSPMRDRGGDLIYWFKIEEDDDGDEHFCRALTDEYGEDSEIVFTGIMSRDFEYDGTYKLACPSCAAEECDFLDGKIVDDGLDEDGWMEDGYDPFVEDMDDEEDDDGDDF